MSPHICARCPKVLGRSCCETRGDERLTSLTRADLARIRDATRLAADKFAEQEILTLDEAFDYEKRRPLYRGYFRGGPVRWTLQQRNHACVFHDRESGCRLPAEAKPTSCKLYPFDLWADGSWSVHVSRFGSIAEARADGESACLAVEEAQRLEDVFRAFGTRLEEIEALGEQLRREVAAHEG